MENLVLLCRDCHERYAHGVDKKAWREEFLQAMETTRVKQFAKSHAGELQRIYKMKRR